MASESWHLSPTVAASLQRIGWRSNEPEVRDVVAPVTRGTSVIVVTPPSPAWAAPAIAGLVAGLEANGGRALVLAAPPMVSEIGAVFSALASDTTIRVEAARGPARAARRVAQDTVDVLVASPATALSLHTRSVLQPERFTSVLFAWPESWDADDAVSAILADVPKEAQRVVLTAASPSVDRGETVAGRYARKALILGVQEGVVTVPIGPVRTVPTSWAGRTAAVASIVELTDPSEVTVWTAGGLDHGSITTALGGGGSGVRMSIRSAPEPGTTICYDLPHSSQLPAMLERGEVILLVPPGTDGYVAAIASPRRPLSVESFAAAQRNRGKELRAEIIGSLTEDDAAAALYVLGPLFEEYESTHVAAALFHLWRKALTVPEAQVETPAPKLEMVGPRTVRLWVGIGNKDGATVADLVAVLVKEVGLPRGDVGKVELRETFSLVEVPTAKSEQIAATLNGVTIRRKRISARLDRTAATRSRPVGGRSFPGRER